MSVGLLSCKFKERIYYIWRRGWDSANFLADSGVLPGERNHRGLLGACGALLSGKWSGGRAPSGSVSEHYWRKKIHPSSFTRGPVCRSQEKEGRQRGESSRSEKTLTCGTQQVMGSLCPYHDSEEGSYVHPRSPWHRGLENAGLKDFNDGCGSS